MFVKGKYQIETLKFQSWGYNMIMCRKLRNWLNDELNDRGWSHRELARRSGISQAQISGFLSGERGIGLDSINAISRVLQIPPEKLLEMVDLLPSTYPKDYTFDEVLKIMKRLSPERRRELLEFAYLQSRLQGKETEESN